MAIPTYEDLMLPMLRVLSNGQEKRARDVAEILADEFGLSKEERERLLPSGQQTFISNRVGWARTHLNKAGLLENTSRGVYRITSLGSEILKQNPARIDNNYLRRFPEFVEWFDVKREKTIDVSSEVKSEAGKTPDESLDIAYQTIRVNLATEIIDKIKSCSPSFFERLVVELLVKMGYGGTLQDAVGEVLGKSGDGGVDGVIKEDRLGLDVIYIQAKRWENVIGSSAIRDFAGALLQKKARKGVFITTSNFTESAKTFVKDIESTGSKIILINGEELAELMIDYNVGVSIATTYEIKRIDSDYFSEE
jgi:restriction system protein